ncbi:hypothetical protein NHQ30_000078 [Ciborinia camelliae]|nr:hypothetical protein NHQ30_000078 [Ciborinia camelliae]
MQPFFNGNSVTRDFEMNDPPSSHAELDKARAGLFNSSDNSLSLTARQNNEEMSAKSMPHCKRHKRGFPRKWNLEEHKRKAHPPLNSHPATGLTDSTGSTSTETCKSRTSPDAHDVGLSVGDLINGESTRLLEKLRKLRERRAEDDKSILALETVLSMMNDSNI